MTLKSKKHILTRAKTLDFLEKLSAAPGESCLALYLPPHLSPNETASLVKEIPATPDITAKLTEITISSPNGAAIVRGGGQKYLIIPPCPSMPIILRVIPPWRS